MIQFHLPDDVMTHTPTIHNDAFIAAGAQVMGNVVLKKMRPFGTTLYYEAILIRL